MGDLFRSKYGLPPVLQYFNDGKVVTSDNDGETVIMHQLKTSLLVTKRCQKLLCKETQLYQPPQSFPKLGSSMCVR